MATFSNWNDDTGSSFSKQVNYVESELNKGIKAFSDARERSVATINKRVKYPSIKDKVNALIVRDEV